MRAEVKYAAIEVNKGKYPVAFMCRFVEVSRSGYYAWRKRKDEPDKDALLGELIARCQKESKETYGYRRVGLWLYRKHGLVVNHKAVLRLMRKYSRPRPLYQSAIKDLCDNFIVAYDMGTAQDNALVHRTIPKAVRSLPLGKKEVADGLILHSDQGGQYTSPGYFDLTKQYGVLPSMSRGAHRWTMLRRRISSASSKSSVSIGIKSTQFSKHIN